MHKAQRLRAGSPLLGFDDLAKEILDGFFATYGFQPEMSRVDSNFAMRRFRNGHRYVSIEAKTHPKEPVLGRVKLGTGSTEWPEAEWNHISLWHLIKASRPDWTGTDYPLEGVLLASFLNQVSKDLQDYAMEFIAGELRMFKKIRADISKKREPYELYTGGPYSENTLKFVRVSKLLKEKYSSEMAA